MMNNIEAFRKIEKCINSCVTTLQLRSCLRMINTFKKTDTNESWRYLFGLYQGRLMQISLV